MYHIYKNGYSTLPNLRKINNEEVFEKNHDESLLIQKEKKDALKNQTFFLLFQLLPPGKPIADY